jgi:hypothetical protein
VSRPNRLMSVDSRLVKDVLVQEILKRAEAHSLGGSPGLPREALDSELAVLGYCARLAETELFEPARAPTPGLAQELEELSAADDWPEAASEVSRRLAAEEPAGRPNPGEGDVASWRVPGPGGHVRHYVAALAAERHMPDADPAESKRAFMYGFFLRCCEESRAEPDS